LLFGTAQHSDLKTPIQVPLANAIMERWIGSLRREVLDRMLIVNARHLMRVLAEYETHFNTHRPLDHAAPLRVSLRIAVLPRSGVCSE
jgi:putative transposase